MYRGANTSANYSLSAVSRTTGSSVSCPSRCLAVVFSSPLAFAPGVARLRTPSPPLRILGRFSSPLAPNPAPHPQLPLTDHPASHPRPSHPVELTRAHDHHPCHRSNPRPIPHHPSPHWETGTPQPGDSRCSPCSRSRIRANRCSCPFQSQNNLLWNR